MKNLEKEQKDSLTMRASGASDALGNVVIDAGLGGVGIVAVDDIVPVS